MDLWIKFKSAVRTYEISTIGEAYKDKWRPKLAQAIMDLLGEYGYNVDYIDLDIDENEPGDKRNDS